MLPQVLLLLHWTRLSATKNQTPDIRLYADEEEKKTMKLCDKRCIEVMSTFMASIRPHAQFRALDVACGDGRFSKGFLLDKYNMVDLFD